MKRLVFLVAGLLLLFAFAAEAVDVEAGLSWCESQLGKSVGSGQCVALVNAYINRLGGKSISGNAADFARNSIPNGWSRVKGGVPQRGDILVYTGAKYGHVAIYAGGNTSYHQNMAGKYVEKKTDWAYNKSWYSKSENGTKSYWGYIRPGGGGSPTPTPTPTPSANIAYRSHVAERGWLGNVSNGQVSGTTGEGRRLEAFVIDCSGVRYRAHVAMEGWHGWVSSGQVAGTTGKSRACEAVQIQLTGSMANNYDIYYRVHAADVGWMGWAKNGEMAGTTGGGKQMEALQIQLVRKGASFNRGGSAYRQF